MFFIETNRLIKNVGDLRAFTTAQDCKLNVIIENPKGLTVQIDLKGLVNRRTVEARQYIVYLEKVKGGMLATKSRRTK